MEAFGKERALRITEARYGQAEASKTMISVDVLVLNKLMLVGDTMVLNRIANEGKNKMWCTECGARANNIVIFRSEAHTPSCDVGCWLAACDELKVGA